MSTNYQVDKSKQGVNGWGLQCCGTVYSATLTANTDTTIAVPLISAMGTPTQTLNKFYAVITCTPSINTYYCINAVAAVPAGANFAPVTSPLVPNGYIAKLVKAGDVLHFISAGTPSITIEFWTVQEG
jgi:hypothetical protein